MPTRPTNSQSLLPSLLDRIKDNDPGIQVETPRNQAQLLRELKQSVRRDLEDLLNTRWRFVGWPEAFTQLDNSLLNYGLPDFAAADLDAGRNPDVLLHAIEECIRRFEPRLKNVRIEQLETKDASDRVFRFRIDGVLCVEPLEDPIRYDSSLEPATGTVHVEGAGR